MNRIRVEPKAENESNESDSKLRAPVDMNRNTVEAAVKAANSVDYIAGSEDFRIKAAISTTKELLEKVADEILNNTGSDSDFNTRSAVSGKFAATAEFYGAHLSLLDDIETTRKTAADALHERLREENTARAYATAAELGIEISDETSISTADLEMVIEKATARGHLLVNEFETLFKMSGVGKANFLSAIKQNKVAPSHGVSGSAYELSKYILANPPIRV